MMHGLMHLMSKQATFYWVKVEVVGGSAAAAASWIMLEANAMLQGSNLVQTVKGVIFIFNPNPTSSSF